MNPTIGKRLRGFRPNFQISKRSKLKQLKKDAIFDLELDFGSVDETVPENEKNVRATIERVCGESHWAGS
jgi:hypothetical protein